MEGYPKTKYPKVGGGSITVASPDQEKMLGDGWQDHPPFVVEPVVEAPKRRGRPPKSEEGDPFEQST